MDTTKSPSVSECIRCGSCCKKGGPSFHKADKHLIEKGIIQLKYLYTIREGELAYDNVRQCLIAPEGDIIKIKEDKNSRACVFFEERGNRCGIYENRPEECRALKCWDTREIEAIYSKNRSLSERSADASIRPASNRSRSGRLVPSRSKSSSRR